MSADERTEGGRSDDGRGTAERNGEGGDDEHVPPGWTSNPSAWSERIPIIVLAIIGVAISGYLGLFQLGITKSVWEPFFGNGSRKILTSGASHVLPIPDAILGAFSYLADAVTGAIGGEDRWRTRPWIVVVFGMAVGPLGAVSITLVILQPVVYNAWCTLCLTSALLSLVMIGPALDEMLASLQYLRYVHDNGGSLWSAFWKGTRRESATSVAGGWEAEA